MIRRSRTAMTHRCTIERDVNHGDNADPWGNDEPASWTDSREDIPCRFWFEDATTVIDGTKASEMTTRKMILPKGTDVTEDDRILSVTDRLGNAVADGPMRIDSVGHRMGHVVVTMVDVR